MLPWEKVKNFATAGRKEPKTPVPRPKKELHIEDRTEIERFLKQEQIDQRLNSEFSTMFESKVNSMLVGIDKILGILGNGQIPK